MYQSCLDHLLSLLERILRKRCVTVKKKIAMAQILLLLGGVGASTKQQSTAAPLRLRGPATN